MSFEIPFSLLGAALYVIPHNRKLNELGRIIFAVGIFAVSQWVYR